MANKPKNGNKELGRNIMLTPPHAIEPLLPVIPKSMIIWESATSEERLMELAFRAKGYNVIGTDICFGQDYFNYEPDFMYDVEATNVPFTEKYKWIEKALSREMPFILIVPYETTFAAAYQTVHKKYGSNLIVLSPERRINFKVPVQGWKSSAQMPTMFLTFKMNDFIEDVYSNPMKTYFIPMRNAKYDSDNQEITPNAKRKTIQPILQDKLFT